MRPAFPLALQIACRNSFQSLVKPDISRVELLKDVTSKEDLMVRLITHDIDKDPISALSLEGKEPESEDEEEKVLQEETSFFFEVPPTLPPAQNEGAAPSVSGWAGKGRALHLM